MSLSDVVDVTITSETKTPTAAGFGLPLITAYHTVFPERVRAYTSIADMITDGFTALSPAYLAAQAVFAPNPSPSQVLIGRTANDEVMSIKLTPIGTPKANYEYSVVIQGQTASFTTTGTPTVAEITAGFKTAIDALSLDVTTTDNTTDLDIEATTVADAFSFYTSDWRDLVLEDNTANGSPGIVEDLTAIRDENDDWYCWIPTNLGSAVIEAAAAHMETLNKFMVVSSLDHDITTTASDDVGSVLNTAGYARTAIVHHPKANYQYAHGRWAGNMLPRDPGSATWKFKSLAGLDYVDYTPTEKINMRGKKVDFYQRVAGLSYMEEGYSSSGEFIDITRSSDFIVARMQEAVFGTLINRPKIPYTDPGAAVVESDVRSVMDLGVGQGIFAADPPYTVTVPLVADVLAADKANRILRDVEFSATFAGAIHKVLMTGRVSV